jgi:imidazolonepropionase-like amidohydrolase
MCRRGLPAVATVCFCFLLTTIAPAQKPAEKLAGAAASPSVALRGGSLLTVSHGVIDNGVVVIEKGKITAVGPVASTIIPKGAQVIDVTGMTVYPGLIDSETRIGLTEISMEQSTNDLLEPSDEIMPQMHVFDAFHAESAVIPVTRVNGITHAIVAPADQDTLPGQDALVQLAGTSRDEMLLVRDIALPLNFTGEQRRNESWEKAKFPFTRMGMAAQLRQAFIDAQDYAKKWEDYGKKPAEQRKEPPPKRDLKLEALLPYLMGSKPVVVAAREPSDLETALSLVREFNLRVILNHVSHSQVMLDRIAAAKLPVIVGPIYEEPKEYERYDVVYKLPAELYRRGVKIAFASYSAHQSRNLPYQAGYAVAFGLPHEQAVRAITLNAAEIWGVADHLGSLDVGKTANVVVANGDPLDIKTDVRRVFIQGREVPMDNRQIRLRDQYMKQ